MINALRAQRLAAAHAPFDAWLYASDVVRNFPWSAWSRVSDAAWADDAGHCAAPLLAPPAAELCEGGAARARARSNDNVRRHQQ